MSDSLPVVVLASNGRQDSAGQCATCCDFPLHLVEAKSASCLSLLEGCVASGLSARKIHNTRSFDITPRHRSRNAGWGFCVSATGSVQSLSLALDDKANGHQLRFTDSDYSSGFDEGSYSFAFFAREAQGSSFSKPCSGRCCF